MLKKRFYFELLIRKMKEQNLDVKVAQDFLIEVKYKIQNYLKKLYLDFVILDMFVIMQLMNSVMLLLCYYMEWLIVDRLTRVRLITL